MVVHHFGDWGCLGLSAGYGQSMRTGEPAIERAVVRLVLERERRLDGLERLLGSGAVAAVKTLAADRVVIRHGERWWASPCLSRLDDLGLIAL
jgi:hypothetical protein